MKNDTKKKRFSPNQHIFLRVDIPLFDAETHCHAERSAPVAARLRNMAHWPSTDV